MPDILTRDERSRLMSRVRAQDTGPELALRRALWSAGLRGWRVHPKGVAGKPDLAWLSRRLAIFVDGAFWHGHPDYYRGQSGAFWDRKIAENKARDERVNSALLESGWRLMRFWDFEIERDLDGCVRRVSEELGRPPSGGAPTG